MGLRIATNIASQTVQKNLREVSEETDNSLNKLSSGKRITGAADDAAGLAIATNLEAQTKSLRQATRNANSGIALIQAAEGGLNEASNILVRMRELTVQSASDTVGDVEREFLNKEFQQLIQEVDRIAESATFNRTKMLNGEGGDIDFQVGSFASEEDQITFDAGSSNATSSGLGISGTSILDKDSAQEAIGSIDESIVTLSGQRAYLGSIQTRLHSTVSNLEVQTVHQDNARSIIQDVDVASESANLAASQVVKQAGVQTLAQANKLPNNALRLIG